MMLQKKLADVLLSYLELFQNLAFHFCYNLFIPVYVRTKRSQPLLSLY